MICSGNGAASAEKAECGAGAGAHGGGIARAIASCATQGLRAETKSRDGQARRHQGALRTARESAQGRSREQNRGQCTAPDSHCVCTLETAARAIQKSFLSALPLLVTGVPAGSQEMTTIAEAHRKELATAQEVRMREADR